MGEISGVGLADGSPPVPPMLYAMCPLLTIQQRFGTLTTYSTRRHQQSTSIHIKFMSTGYTKLFSSILYSSIWQEDSDTKVVWITLMALANRDGVVEASLPGIANTAKVPIKVCEGAIKKFMEPDQYSRSEEEEGRRLVRVDGGWKLVNYVKYRNTLNAEERREYKRVKQAGYRAKRGGCGSSTLAERLEAAARTPEEAARMQELASGVAPGSLGSYGPEAQAVVSQREREGQKSLGSMGNGGGGRGSGINEPSPAMDDGDIPDPDAS